jgi:RNA polymerase sigma-70 factor, ECF subfamily
MERSLPNIPGWLDRVRLVEGASMHALTPSDASDALPFEPAPSLDHVLRAHGAEIYGWLLATLPSDTEAGDAFALFSEELWRSLARHQGRCSMRTWCYMLARHVATRVRDHRHAERAVPLSAAPISQLPAPRRDSTQGYLRTDVKQRVRSLRDQLEPDDQLLLVLRVDKDLGWRDIALVLHGAGTSDTDLARHAAALRKRFERIKARLREAAAAAQPAAG